MADTTEYDAIAATLAQANAAAAYAAGVGTVANVQATSAIASSTVAAYDATPEAAQARAFSPLVNGGLAANQGLKDFTLTAHSIIGGATGFGGILDSVASGAAGAAGAGQGPGASDVFHAQALGPTVPVIAGIPLTPPVLLLGGVAAVALVFLLIAAAK